jgi:redox-sensitive bicupin YhaK (pirin superfamily)
MSAGRGIYHSEVNASSTQPFHSFQIWVLPEKMNIEPRHEVLHYGSGDKLNKLLTVISPDRREGSIFINQDVYVSLSTLDEKHTLHYEMIKPDNGVYVHVVKGEITIGEITLTSGDAVGIYQTSSMAIRASQPSELIFVETPVDTIKFEV